MRRAGALLAAGAAAVLVAGCSGESTGQPEPAPMSSTGSSAPSSAGGSSAGSDLPHSGAPEVTNPLPESVLSGDPCQALTRDQQEWALGSDVSDGKRRDIDILGPRCSWDNDGGGFTLSFLTVTRGGLSVNYANAKDAGNPLREVDPVQGLPTITLPDQDVGCSAVVGLADEYAVSVTVAIDDPDDDTHACDSALRLSDMVVGNLKDKA
ncbi:DUF3558 domain-containing protein [Prauserella halophila]|uniref:DUF3558 domain-containing protein n=1 Tax=Prauserella halophila TaxID=185641 RepID=A0ABP4GT57_9PSEU|nr:DUF3558 domain-containing protein [Prauserella halophila]MCP2236066.1 Protein of unknown function (DUF3558) [Prauserella halophila]